MAQAQNTSQDAVSGLQPLSYLNQNQAANVLSVRQKRAPTAQDRRFKFGTLWLDTAANTVYALVSVTNNAAFWSLLGSGTGDLDTLTGDTGGPIVPTSGNINISGGSFMSVAGSGSTLTINSTNTAGQVTLINGNNLAGTTAATAGTFIFLTYEAVSGTPGILRVQGRTPGGNFAIDSGSGTDSSLVSWVVIAP